VTAVVGALVMTAGLVAEATGGRLAGGSAERAFNGVSTDSRSLAEGALFVALRGDRFDGHAFLPEAIRRGAAGLLVSEMPAPLPSTAAVVVVDDTLAALQCLGREIRRRSGARVVAITGSTGKTTTKEATAELLALRYRVFRNRGNLNNHIGLPLSLTELYAGPDVAVVELGMNHAGEIRTLISLAEPDVRVWTNVGDAHFGFFGSREAIARAKAEVLEAAKPADVAVLNADDALVMAHADGFAGRVVTFGESETATVRAKRVIERGIDGTSADVQTPAGAIRIDVPLPGRAQLLNVLAALAVASEFDVPLGDIADRVRRLVAVARRGAVTMLPNGVRVVDDSYNASPAAVRMMVAALAATPTRGRRIAVIGEMLELGDASAALHESAGRAAADAGIDILVAVGGPGGDALAAGAREAGLPEDRVHRFADSESAARAVRAMVMAGDLVLVKGSRGTRTDIIADRLQEVG
jgi:UDP-N-acetylmuramoyl-tripeptide--D-alanyl-D-alanine ligase